MYDYSKLTGRIIEKFGSRRAFASAIGRSESEVSNFIRGKRKFTQNDILIWASALDIALEDIGLYFFAKIVDSCKQ